ncbi:MULTISPECIES: hypothetical protein [Pseudofrankia]|uniref:hypothetical protein n=1 Tax=Pseudofrankia TaxID=2994363 RepID=UPI000234B6AE|nr:MULTISPECIES: hypothetical protein [Pseudofrankia]OHV35964.1 hypothetical protein BCD49_20315 [Pseudofrankia sp. EUN1h]
MGQEIVGASHPSSATSTMTIEDHRGPAAGILSDDAGAAGPPEGRSGRLREPWEHHLRPQYLRSRHPLAATVALVVASVVCLQFIASDAVERLALGMSLLLCTAGATLAGNAGGLERYRTALARVIRTSRDLEQRRKALELLPPRFVVRRRKVVAGACVALGALALVVAAWRTDVHDDAFALVIAALTVLSCSALGWYLGSLMRPLD